MVAADSALSESQMSDFLSQHRLPPQFRQVANRYYLPLARTLESRRRQGVPLLLGINGAQGTGKSTLADFIQLATASMFGWNAAVLSIDDFYYTRQERQTLADEVHPLLLTRGVPGTHDTSMLAGCLTDLRRAGSEDSVALPRFDKATDDRADRSQWPVVSGPIDLIILEGWCVATEAQPDSELKPAVNDLEREDDADGAWRRYVNAELRLSYEPIFAQLDFLVFIRAPSFDAILRWRLEQEQKLADVSPAGSSGLMSREQITRFIQFYERLTRANLATLPERADVVINLDESHSVASSTLAIAEHDDYYQA